MGNIKYGIYELVGHTQIMELQNFEKKHHLQANILAKLEYLNPTGSVKDRAAWNMILDAEEKGEIHPGDTIVEQTSGNTGISLAAFAASRGYKTEIFLERGASKERRQLLEAYGAKLLDYRDALGIRTEEERKSGWHELEREATLKEIYAYCDKQKEKHYFINQASNLKNPEAHILTTGPEIWNDTDGNVDILICMTGTGGTAAGLSKYLKERNPHIQIVLAQPAPQSRLTDDNPNAEIIDGVLPFQGVADEDIPEFVSKQVYDSYMDVSTQQAYEVARDVVATDGILIGTSSAAALFVAKELAQKQQNKDKNIVVIMPDNGMKYLSTSLFSD